MTSPHVLRLGRLEAAPTPRPLRAGPVTLVLDGADLRILRLGDDEVLRRVYAAVRDSNWGTVPGTVSNLAIDQGADHFRVRFDALHRQGDVDFTWQGEMTGSSAGTITFVFDGVARSRFMRNRIGLCVLHPAACAGLPVQVEHTDGRLEPGRFPDLIDGAQPVLPFADLRAVTHSPRPGVSVEVRFDGEVFETEDQRNWTDGSFKTFGTPLALPVPVAVAPGDRVRQVVTVRLLGEAAHEVRGQRDPAVISVGSRPLGALPAIGLGVASHGVALDEQAMQRLRMLAPRHLRVDCQAGAPGAQAALLLAAEQARALGAALELAVIALPETLRGLDALATALHRARPRLARILVHAAREHYRGGTPVRALVDAARAVLGPAAEAAPFAAGTNTDFIFLNRNPPPVEVIDEVAFAVNPQVHAFDEASMVETLEALDAAVRTAAHLGEGKPVVISPVTLKPRFNPYATGASAEPMPDQLPDQVDTRQASLFGAAWTVGCLRALATAGARSVTLYETSGWRGVLTGAEGVALPGRFPAAPRAVFPLFHPLADVCELTSGRLVETTSSERLHAEALAMADGGRSRILVASYLPREQLVRLEGLGAEVRLTVMDETTAEAAMHAPERHRAGFGETLGTVGGVLELRLRPFAVARLDA